MRHRDHDRVVTAIDRGGGETVALGSEDHGELFF